MFVDRGLSDCVGSGFMLIVVGLLPVLLALLVCPPHCRDNTLSLFISEACMSLAGSCTACPCGSYVDIGSWLYSVLVGDGSFSCTHTHTLQTRMMALAPTPEAQYRNIFQAFSTIVSQEKPRALFRGIGVVATGAGPAHALYFACYEYCKKMLSREDGSNVLAQGELTQCMSTCI